MGAHLGSLLLVLDLAGVLVFATAGALLAVQKGLDIVGALALATVTGLAGGWIRDVLIGAIPPAALIDWRYLAAAVVAALLTFYLHPVVGRLARLVGVFDAFGLGIFCVAGALKALSYGLDPLPAVLLGVVTAVGGGALRDVAVLRVPVVFGGSELYAVPATAGAALAVAGRAADLPLPIVAAVAAAVAALWRLLAISRQWRAPLARVRATTREADATDSAVL